jgi:hypothetical protein
MWVGRELSTVRSSLPALMVAAEREMEANAHGLDFRAEA